MTYMKATVKLEQTMSGRAKVEFVNKRGCGRGGACACISDKSSSITSGLAATLGKIGGTRAEFDSVRETFTSLV